LAIGLEMKQTSAGKRRGELRDMGLVFNTGNRRPSDTGSPAIVWDLTPLGVVEARSMKRGRR
jgi:hypothetical protein